jgi:hypothetical protein
MQLRYSIQLISAVLILLAPTAAQAEDERSNASSEMERGYAYTFEDDPLGATPFADRGARLTVRPIGKRTLLIRPRTHFIAELFKSAEDL